MVTNVDKLQVAIKKILESPEASEVLFDMLANLDFKVLRGLSHMSYKDVDPERRASARTAIVMDTETTGLDHKKDKIIQLAMIKVLYDDQGIVEISDEVFDQFQDPGMDLPEEIIKLTGITNEQVKGQKINQQEAAEFIANADLIMAHNAGFDRRFVEYGLPEIGFRDKRWACTINNVQWAERHTGSVKLELLLLAEGHNFPAHNAQADIKATAFMLTRSFDGDKPVMAEIADSLDKPFIMVMATGAPFEKREVLKNGGFKWSADRDGEAGEKTWWIMVSTPKEAEEAAAVVKEAFGGDVMLPIRKFTPYTMYSDRLPPVIRNGFEVRNPLKCINAEDLILEDREKPGQISLSF